MAEGQAPSPARLRRALREGDSPISLLSVRAVTLVVLALLGPGLARAVAARFTELLRTGLAAPTEVKASALVADAALLVAPLLCALAAAGLVSGLAQTGGVIVFRSGTRRPPRILNAPRMYEALRGVIIAASALVVSCLALVEALPEIASALRRSSVLLGATGSLTRSIAWGILAVLLPLSVIDVVVVRAAWISRWRVSPEDSKRERREAEGDPHLRRARRRAHEDVARGPREP